MAVPWSFGLESIRIMVLATDQGVLYPVYRV
jgi:hypothetical protein